MKLKSMVVALLGVCSIASAYAFTPVDTNIALDKTVTAMSGAGFATLSGSLPTLTDGIFLPEYNTWNVGTVYWTGFGGFTVDLGQDYVISSMSVQRDNNDGYFQTTTDSQGILTFTLFPPQLNGGGMTTSSVIFGSPIVANKLSFISAFGDNSYSMSEISVMGHVASVPEPETYAMFLAGLGLMGTIARRRRIK